MNLKPYREIFQDVRYRAEQYGFIVESKFDREESLIQVKRKSDNKIIFRILDKIGHTDSGKKEQIAVFKSQKVVYSHFVSYMAFYGLFTVAASYDEEIKEKKEREKVSLKKGE